MQEIEVKTLTKQPAIIEFNHDEILQDLEKNLKKYDGLTFTESETKELRSVLAELRKGVKVVDRYRIDTKKELNKPINEFESKCKDIAGKFDERIGSLDKQLKDYEQQWKEKRIVKVQEVIANVLNESNLNEKYAARLVVDDDHLKKSVNDNRLKEMIEFQADGLLQEQEKEEADKDMIETYVKLKNSEHGLSFSISPYLSQLEFKDTQGVKNTIITDVENEVERRELQKKKEEEQQRILEEKAEEKKREEELEVEEKETISVDDIPFEPSMAEMNDPVIDDLPFGDIEEEKQGVGIDYIVTTSVEKHKELVDFMNRNNIEFFTREELPF